MPLTPDAVAAQLALDARLDRILDDQERDLIRTWALAWDEVSPDLRDTLIGIAKAYDAGDPIPRSAFARSAALSAVLAVIADRLETLGTEFGVRVVRDLPDVVTMAANGVRDVLRPQLPDVFRFPPSSRIEAAPLDAIVKRATQQITSPRWHLSDQAYDAVRRELVRGVAVGAGPRDVAGRMVRRAEYRFNGGLSRALGIARTEMLDANRAAAKYGQDRHSSVLAGWTWLTHLDPKTCRSCIAQHGSFHELDEPGPLDHQQGRCARLPTVRPWSEIAGVDDDTVDSEPVSAGLVDADEWFAGLTEQQQRDILGRAGFAAWRRGEWPRDEWSRRRRTDGWRDSFVPAPAPGG